MYEQLFCSMIFRTFQNILERKLWVTKSYKNSPYYDNMGGRKYVFQEWEKCKKVAQKATFWKNFWQNGIKQLFMFYKYRTPQNDFE